MIVGVPSEPDGERRVAVTPEVAGELSADGHDVLVESGAGTTAGIDDAAYRDADCEIVDRAELTRADLIAAIDGSAASEIGDGTDGATVVGVFGAYEQSEADLAALADRSIDAIALELIPRISRAQSMDVLSSMASLAGYQAALLGASEADRLFPMEMTAAGTIQPAEVFVIGAGVAGLKAISTADRLGASVRAYDVRLEAREEVQSLGAEFVELDLETEGAGDDEGYAREMDEEFYAAQREALARVVPESDVVITTAAIPGQPAPELVTSEMVAAMDDGSVLVDCSADTGGNCALTEPDQRVTHEGVTVLGPTDLAGQVAATASDQFARNVAHLLELITDEGALALDLDDEIVAATLLTHEGRVRAPHRDDGESSENGADDDGGADETDGADGTDTNGGDADDAGADDGDATDEAAADTANDGGDA
ncbi:Re/Si-specific NAD(P)(+) transhydrogenase subunit alpha [Halococcoides cellulosivorans]|uniref:proton-translocating NAD(P)(+) transhydrogenase n=1 Tax=Halococcoides cellulosivorans TaxID=1679096 RepID=A0A2R4X411_9EURY|nr:Re/Si-specific NAD(P)(+) transhydrogenase subunit alpha [Halococcoides cellulosivorans]AWB28527.1 Re/Si-specific NAD(P)(+) transhydrogenase subunit alpha [Halococcoides cellulosivorans]